MAGVIWTPTLTMPVPVRPISWGLPTALSVMVMVPDCAPAAVGVKVTLIVQVPFTASVDGLMGQLFVCANCVLAAMLVMLSAALPVLVSVTDCDRAGRVQPADLGSSDSFGESVTGGLPVVVKLHSGPTAVPVELLTVAYHS